MNKREYNLDRQTDKQTLPFC